jgi:gluconolactonase
MLLLALTACTPTHAGLDDTASDDTATTLCWDDLAPGDTAPLATGFADGTEGIAFSDGHLLVAFPTGVVEIAADGTVGDATPLDHALGLAPAVGGTLVADPGEFTFDGSGDDGHLRYVGVVPGFSTDLATGIPNPNFVASTPWGEVLVSDDTGDAVYAVDYTSGAGTVRTWLTGVPSPNGMAFSPDGATLYVVSTFTPDPPVWRVPVAADGTPGTPEALATLDSGSAPDGLAIDADGGVWVAANLAGEIVRIDPATGATSTFVPGLTTPASLAFGAGDGFDPCSLYATELYGENVMRIATGVPGLTVDVAEAPPDL